MSKHKRSLMAQFLTGILSLKIKIGRFKKIRDPSSGELRCLNNQERICEMCTINDFFFDEAIQFNVDFQSFSNIAKFIWLINNNWRDVVNILLAAFQTRSSVLCSVK